MGTVFLHDQQHNPFNCFSFKLGCVNGAITDYEKDVINYTFTEPGEYKISLKMKTPIDFKENDTTITIQQEIK